MITFSECITRINQILNYPSLTYIDISHFFDQAIAELNSTFRIGLPLVSEMVKERAVNIQKLPNHVFLKNRPTGYQDIDILPNVDDSFADTNTVYYRPTTKLLYVYNNATSQWVGYPKLYATYFDGHEKLTYESIVSLAQNNVAWFPVDEKRLNDFALDIYLPDDWVILFLIPYVCFKASVRDGADGSLYHEEFTQGFQQLQTSYDVPNFVTLSTVAHLPAYSAEAEKHIAALNITIPTRAVYSSMKIGNAILPEYGGFYTNGGWCF